MPLRLNIEGTIMNELPIDPAAVLFPKLPEDELRALADDIRENGQRDAVIVFVDADGNRSLLDGRNRVAACKLVGVEPKEREVTCEDIGSDPVSYVLGKNIYRRHLTKQQRAMAVAMLCPQKGRGQTPKNLDFAPEYLRQARTVLKHDIKTARLVLADELSLHAAYQKASGEASGNPNASGADSTSSRYPTRKRRSSIKRAPSEDDRDRTIEVLEAAFRIINNREESGYDLVQKYGDPFRWKGFADALKKMQDASDAAP